MLKSLIEHHVHVSLGGFEVLSPTTGPHENVWACEGAHAARARIDRKIALQRQAIKEIDPEQSGPSDTPATLSAGPSVTRGACKRGIRENSDGWTRLRAGYPAQLPAAWQYRTNPPRFLKNGTS